MVGGDGGREGKERERQRRTDRKTEEDRQKDRDGVGRKSRKQGWGGRDRDTQRGCFQDKK